MTAATSALPDDPVDPVEPILQVQAWPSNAELIRDVARLGYLRKGWRTLDCTWGEGVFWKLWQPDDLWASDLGEPKSPLGESIDFRFMPMFPDGFFDAVVLDGPYKLNGTPDPEVDARYGTDAVATWQQRMTMIEQGITECARVLGDGCLLVKCQDQVCRHKVRWQTIEFTNHARTLGLGLVDRFDRIGTRPQPGEGKTKSKAKARPQRHARHNVSTALVFRRGWETRA